MYLTPLLGVSNVIGCVGFALPMREECMCVRNRVHALVCTVKVLVSGAVTD